MDTIQWRQYYSPMTPSNQPDAVNPAITSRLHSEYHWRGVSDPERCMRARFVIQLFALFISFAFCFTSSADTYQRLPERDWTFHAGDMEFGLTGFSSYTFISYGPDCFAVPLSLGTLIVVSSGISLLLCAFVVRGLRRSHDYSA